MPDQDIAVYLPEHRVIHARTWYAPVDTFGRTPRAALITEDQFTQKQQLIDQLRTAGAYPPELDQPLTSRR